MVSKPFSKIHTNKYNTVTLHDDAKEIGVLRTNIGSTCVKFLFYLFHEQIVFSGEHIK